MGYEIWKMILLRGGLLLFVGGGSACSNYENQWEEEVQFSDGRVMVVEREILRERGGDEWASNPSGTKPKEYKIRFEYPVGSGGSIEWRSQKMSSMRWPEKPLILDIENGNLVVFSDWGKECHTYVKYVYRNGKWIEEALPEVFEARKTNLLIFATRENLKFINLATKQKKNADVTARVFSQVGPKINYCK